MSRFVIAAAGDGWLNVRKESDNAVLALPEFLKVDFVGTFDEDGRKRDKFTIQEGVNKDIKASVRQTGGKSNLGTPMPAYKPAAIVRFHRRSRSIEIGAGASKVALSAMTHPGNPIATGFHTIQIPDFPHELGRGYMGRSDRALSWFYLGIGNALPGNNDRYLHTGSVSAGCVTVTDVVGWRKLYDILIPSRGSDAKSVGTIAVVDD